MDSTIAGSMNINTDSGVDPGGALEKDMIFWRKIVIFHTKYPNMFRVSLRSAQFF
jgi:hypothetical protein